jgi:hypothetical protein
MRARLATNQFSRKLTTAMHLLFLSPTRFLSVARKPRARSLAPWFNGAQTPTPVFSMGNGLFCIWHRKPLRRFWFEKDSWFFLFLFLHYTLFPQECRSSDLSFDGWIASLLFVAIAYGYLGRMLLPCGNHPKGMLAFRIHFKYIIKQLSPALRSCIFMCHRQYLVRSTFSTAPVITVPRLLSRVHASA